MVASLLTARGLNKQFRSGNQPVSVFRNLSLQLDRGESLALTGRSGSGKSTLLNILCGLEQPDTGSVQVLDEVFEGNNTDRQTEARWANLRRQQIGVVFQEANLMPALSLLDNVRLRAGLAGQNEDDCRDWLERLRIGELAGRFPDQVSGGQRQRAALAMVFAMNPALILADEPTGSLDRHTAEDVTGQLFDLQSRHGCGLILATHDAELATRCSHHLDLGHLPET
ncbi:lipoprotein-releasing system ATP-binding protein lolD [Marinobacter lipolyticus SM19]|uniref:Lipoprotein-releasing system ATP-binding protein lolD n=1 Tax=Marinobacter lipolyticus SM19 TaxID=1318628 RepID=R8AY41_9GAMM|nr:ATP-binding cassette domain-containing protein [Marinobacter lipolyticus]EON91251.1 lipoprotein-releasing system ATP-binding protein lolD [Marinobacter lipolyticus SM19]